MGRRVQARVYTDISYTVDFISIKQFQIHVSLTPVTLMHPVTERDCSVRSLLAPVTLTSLEMATTVQN